MNNSNAKASKIYGKNSVIEMLNSDVTVNKIWLQDVHNPKLKEIEKLARAKKVPVLKLKKQDLDRVAEGNDHRSVIAETCPIQIHEESFLYDKNNQLKKILIAANIEDTHNLGAIVRSAHAFGIDALVVTSRKSAPINDTVVKTSAGAIFKVDIVRIPNLSQSIAKLKDAGFWIYGTNVRQEGTEALDKIKFDEKSVLIVGNEGKGLSSKIMEHCDFMVHIPVKFESLNVSVASSVLMYELMKG